MSTTYQHRGSALGSNPDVHQILDGDFTCSAPADAPCRTSPTCECETWCGCDGSPQDAQDNHDGDHCCMTTTAPGQSCWIGPWIDAIGTDEAQNEDDIAHDDDGERVMPDGPVWCDWDDGITWGYATTDAEGAEG